MRTIVILSFCFAMGSSSVFAQEAGKLRAGLEIGCLLPLEGGGGVLGAIELKYNLQNNMNVGLKTEVAGFLKHESYDAVTSFFSATYDYYFYSTCNRISYFVGVGLGYYYCKAWDMYYRNYNLDLNSKFNNPAFFIRSGFELGKFRTSLTYNLIRKPSEISPHSRKNDYLALNIGFYLGGGKWK